MNAATVLTTRQGQYAVLETALPGQEPTAAGVLLYEPSEDRLELRLRRDWDHITEPEDAEVLSLLEDDFRKKIRDLGASRFLELLEDSLSNVVRIADRVPVLLGDFGATLNRLYRQHVSATVLEFQTHLPQYSCQAAAGRFGDQMETKEERWVEVPPTVRLLPQMFVAEVKGHSMEPEIPDGSLCVFRGDVVGSRQGKKLLIENYGETDTHFRYTVKRYRSRKTASGGDAWKHEMIRLEPLNPEFEAWEMKEFDQFRVIAEFVRVLE